MLLIKNITIRNFLSCGNVTQTVELDKNGLSLVLGENLDLGGNGSRNGVGKSTILQAISFGLYGQSLTNIRVNNLINNINQKNMMVCVEFEKNGHKYKIERGRKPNFFRYIVDGKNVDETTDEAQGENRETQKEIDQLLGMSHALFKHIVALNTYTEPFLSLGAQKQREIIEELLGITQLSQKAENLKMLLKSTKAAIEQEEFRIRTVKQSNERISATILEIKKKADAWNLTHATTIDQLKEAIANLATLDIKQEIQAHRDLEKYNQYTQLKSQYSRELNTKQRHLTQLSNHLQTAINNYAKASNHECPTCGQDIHDHANDKIKNDLEQKLIELDDQTKTAQNEYDAGKKLLDDATAQLNTLIKPLVFYETLEQALRHQNTIEQLVKDLDKEQQAINPYADQTSTLANTVQEVSYDDINALITSRDHQDFLLKLLTNKDSFIRKRIIDQNLAYLNLRLSDYLDKLGLPHKITFMNDLSVEITMHGQELDFDNLSRGERTRLILGLSWAFRDIFENTTHSINLIFVDELLDSGMDPQGLEGSIEVLKKMERERNKNIFIISHREELINRVSNVLTVVKENNFTSFTWDYAPAV
jgi:DNA repair exonuclease SbcCD ATPase subunit